MSPSKRRSGDLCPCRASVSTVEITRSGATRGAIRNLFRPRPGRRSLRCRGRRPNAGSSNASTACSSRLPPLSSRALLGRHEPRRRSSAHGRRDHPSRTVVCPGRRSRRRVPAHRAPFRPAVGGPGPGAQLLADHRSQLSHRVLGGQRVLQRCAVKHPCLVAQQAGFDRHRPDVVEQAARPSPRPQPGSAITTGPGRCFT